MAAPRSGQLQQVLELLLHLVEDQAEPGVRGDQQGQHRALIQILNDQRAGLGLDADLIHAGVKEIKNNLSRFLARVKQGEEVVITERGKLFFTAAEFLKELFLYALFRDRYRHR